MKGRIRIAACTAALLATSATVRAGELDAFKDKAGTLRIAGGTAHIPVMKEAAERIIKAYPAIRISIAGGGSGVGVKMVGEGLVEIGNTGRAVTEAEQKQYNLVSFAFAIDGVAAVIHPGNPVANLDSDTVRDIFAGKITDWKEVGGKAGSIDLYTRDEASGTRAVFWTQCLAKGAIADKANVVPSNGAMKVAVSRDPRAIGYVSIGHLDESVKAPTLDGVAPSQANAAAGKYPVVRQLYMNTKGKPAPLAQAFIDYLFGPAGRQIVAAAGYIPVSAP
ncbi:MAG: phosphate ABC transporter substrate-binding protein [Kiritimatiellae bacterium]|nr:phosphate ABC transporter substrate-binding protein [Kiritimatiellia bacterium]